MTTPQGMLAPCPFCGSQPTHWPHLGLVKCECHAQALDYRWNTRLSASPAAPKGQENSVPAANDAAKEAGSIARATIRGHTPCVGTEASPAGNGGRQSRETLKQILVDMIQRNSNRLVVVDYETTIDYILAALTPAVAPDGAREITDAMIEAGARELWNDRDARHGGPWDSRSEQEVCVIQTKATMRAALKAALARPLEPATEADLKPYYSDDPDCIPGN